MTEPEVIEMMYESLSYADRNFEFWISASFAVILAFHFSADRISTLMYRLITFLYCSAAVLFVSRFFVAATQYAAFRQQLIDMNASIYVSGNLTEALIGVTYVVVIICGTAGTVFFGFRTSRNTLNRR